VKSLSCLLPDKSWNGHWTSVAFCFEKGEKERLLPRDSRNVRTSKNSNVFREIL